MILLMLVMVINDDSDEGDEEDDNNDGDNDVPMISDMLDSWLVRHVDSSLV